MWVLQLGTPKMVELCKRKEKRNRYAHTHAHLHEALPRVSICVSLKRDILLLTIKNLDIRRSGAHLELIIVTTPKIIFPVASCHSLLSRVSLRGQVAAAAVKVSQILK